MEFFVPLAAKSLVIAAGALLLLKLTERRRSASDRSLIAHLGLLAVLLLPLATLALPALEVTGPAFLAEPAIEAPATAPSAVAPEVAASAATFPGSAGAPTPAPFDWQLLAYAVPAVLLLLLTLIALLRLVPLKARASVLVDPHWLSALAHAQRRMGFKNGTALLTSNDLKSPISWGLLRPTILLNAEATEAHDQAEAIIAHELAHVGNFDWAKLLLARVAVAMFWFNPLVWLLSREAHQLREEAADDAVLAADIEDTQYASLLVGVARHECNGLLIGAHGVAPGRGSLARRVRRVLDAASERAPGGWRWSSAAAFFAAGMAVPVAALSLVAPATPPDALSDSLAAVPAARSSTDDPLAVTPLTPAHPVTPATALAAAQAMQQQFGHELADRDDDSDADVAEDIADAKADLAEARQDALEDLADLGSDDGPVSVRVNPNWNPGPSISDAVARATATARGAASNPLGITPAYVAAIRASSPSLRSVTAKQLTNFRVHGVTPGYVRELHALGVRGINADQLTSAAIHGVTVNYVRGISAAGYPRSSLGDLVQMRIFGVTAGDAARMRRVAGAASASDLIQAKIHGDQRDDP